jgi:hypothetical protein
MFSSVMRVCYACGSHETVRYRQPNIEREYELWYINHPTDLVLCNRCYCYLIKNPRHDSLCQSDITYSHLHKCIRKNRPKPSVCEKCGINPPREVVNIDVIYEKDISHFRWMCVSCHSKLDGRGRHFANRPQKMRKVSDEQNKTVDTDNMKHSHELSHVVMVNKKSKSIKTVIPRKVVEVLNIKSDDVLQWEYSNSEQYVRVRRLK